MVKKFLSDEDQKVWDQYIQGIKPLHSAQIPAELTREQVTPLKRLGKENSPRINHPVKPPHTRQLKNIHIHGRLDLHGLTQDQAYDRLCSFIERAAREQKRCVLIITGKGQTEKNLWWQEMGVLKQQVPRWLEEEPLRSLITSFTLARPEHGGTGALYVFLKRK